MHIGVAMFCTDYSIAPTELAAALEQLVTNPALRTRLGATGRDRLETDFRWHDKLELVRSAYRKYSPHQTGYRLAM